MSAIGYYRDDYRRSRSRSRDRGRHSLYSTIPYAPERDRGDPDGERRDSHGYRDREDRDRELRDGNRRDYRDYDRDRDRDRGRDRKEDHYSRKENRAPPRYEGPVPQVEQSDDLLPQRNDDPRIKGDGKKEMKVQKIKGGGRNTESFDPRSTLVRPAMRVMG